jgi:Xaa-Pro aminopeptidase
MGIEKKFTEFLNYKEIKKFIGFGGIWLEDDILITENGNRLPGKPIPKTVDRLRVFVSD